MQINVDGTGCWRDNVSVSDSGQGLERYLTFYNQTRPHWALDGQTPDQVYYDNLTTRLTAA